MISKATLDLRCLHEAQAIAIRLRFRTGFTVSSTTTSEALLFGLELCDILFFHSSQVGTDSITVRELIVERIRPLKEYPRSSPTK